MARDGEDGSRAASGGDRVDAPADRNGSDLCLECGLCCSGTLFGELVVRVPEREYVESLGLKVGGVLGEGYVVTLPCTALVGRCCSLYEVGRPTTCDSYRCDVLVAYTAGEADLDDSLDVIGTMRSLTAATAAAMGLVPGTFTMAALDLYLDEHEPWTEPAAHARFLGEYLRYSDFARDHFGYTAKPAEEKAAAAGALLAAGA